MLRRLAVRCASLSLPPLALPDCAADCFGEAGLAKVGGEVISCSGWTQGSWDAMLAYAGGAGGGVRQVRMAAVLAYAGWRVRACVGVA